MKKDTKEGLKKLPTMNLPTLEKTDISGKRVLVRLDLDIPEGDDTRLEVGTKTLDYLKNKNADIIIIGHRGRPGGVPDNSLSLKGLQPFFDKWGAKIEENLRFDPGEEANDPEFARELATLGEVYVNEAFAVSHREHASIVGIPKFLPHAAGFRFIAEVENLSGVLEKPRRPIVLIISGVKEDKVDMAKALAEKFDKVLVGGKLPLLIQNGSSKIRIANLTPDTKDIAPESIQMFKQEIAKAGTIILAGVLGVYEDESHRRGTREIFEAVANSRAFKIAGGGDTEAALTMFNLTGKFDWISVGGGAMLEFLTKGTLPGIEALK